MADAATPSPVRAPSAMRRRLAAAWTLFGPLLVLAALPGRADALAPTRDDVDAWPDVRVLVDRAGTLSAEAALARAAAFAPPAVPRANFGVRAEVLRLRVPLDVPAGHGGRWMLDIDYPSLDRIDVHLVADGRLQHLATLGDAAPTALAPV